MIIAIIVLGFAMILLYHCKTANYIEDPLDLEDPRDYY